MSKAVAQTLKTFRRALKGVNGKERQRLLIEIAALSWEVSESAEIREAVTLLRSELAQSSAG